MCVTLIVLFNIIDIIGHSLVGTHPTLEGFALDRLHILLTHVARLGAIDPLTTRFHQDFAAMQVRIYLAFLPAPVNIPRNLMHDTVFSQLPTLTELINSLNHTRI